MGGAVLAHPFDDFVGAHGEQILRGLATGELGDLAGEVLPLLLGLIEVDGARFADDALEEALGPGTDGEQCRA